MPKTLLPRANKWILASVVLLFAIQPLRATNPAKHRKIVLMRVPGRTGRARMYLKSARNRRRSS
jgi:hypothetical protein